jgi:iron complex outermembrane receptor protein
MEYRPLDALQLVWGGRWDAITYDYTNHLTPSSTTGAPSESRRYQHVSPKLGMTWNLSPTLNLYANHSQGFTPPEVSAQYGGALTAPQLKEASFYNDDIGIRWVGLDRRLMADIGVYRLRGVDEIISYSTAPGVSSPRNAGKTLHQGVEFGVSYQFLPKWQAKLNGSYARHTYQDYQISSTQNFNDKSMPAAPKYLVNTELSYEAVPGLKLSSEIQYVGRYWMDDTNSVAYPGHTLVNLRAQYQQGPWSWWASVQNASNRHYAEIAASSYKGTSIYQPNTQNTYTPGAPRTLLLGISYTWGSPTSRVGGER